LFGWSGKESALTIKQAQIAIIERRVIMMFSDFCSRDSWDVNESSVFRETAVDSHSWGHVHKSTLLNNVTKTNKWKRSRQAFRKLRRKEKNIEDSSRNKALNTHLETKFKACWLLLTTASKKNKVIWSKSTIEKNGISITSKHNSVGFTRVIQTIWVICSTDIDEIDNLKALGARHHLRFFFLSLHPGIHQHKWIPWYQAIASLLKRPAKYKRSRLKLMLFHFASR
jgi:hypothetical protein